MLDLLTLLVLRCSVEHGEEGGGGSPHCGSHPSCGVHHLFDLGLSVQSWFSGKTESVSVKGLKDYFGTLYYISLSDIIAMVLNKGVIIECLTF